MDIQGDIQITLVIKAPNQRMEDQTVDCMLGWTIRKLKHHLESVYPSKPKHHEQRLIYSGKLLQDHLTLKEILKQYDTDITSSTHTVHLVCSNASSPTTSAVISSTSSTSQKATEITSPPSTVINPVSQSTSSSNLEQSPAPDVSDTQSDGLRYRGTTNPSQYTPLSSNFQTYLNHQYQPMTTPVPPTGYPYSPEQYAWMVQQQQQAYSQYMMQYMQYYQQSLYGATSGGMLPPFNPANMATTLPATPLLPQQQQQQQQPAQAQAQQQPAAVGNNANNAQRGGNNVRMNAQGGMEEEDDDERDPRDWLHHTYFIMRFITFVGIIVFYSSFSRFFMVMGGFLVIYFFQKVRVAREQNVRRQQQDQEQQEQQEQGDNGAVAPEQQPQEAQQDRNTPEENTPTPDEVDNSNQDQTQTPEEAVAQQEDGSKVKRVLFFVWRTVESFFSSLVPAPPELMEAN